jgi:hypothetical protein
MYVLTSPSPKAKIIFFPAFSSASILCSKLFRSTASPSPSSFVPKST